jgi:hypothetical protein
MQWQATDQFGNLFVAQSEATDFEALKPELASLVEELASRNGEGFRVTFDFEYGEINGPHPEQVSHVIRSEWLPSMAEDAGFWTDCSVFLEGLEAVGMSLARAG